MMMMYSVVCTMWCRMLPAETVRSFTASALLLLWIKYMYFRRRNSWGFNAGCGWWWDEDQDGYRAPGDHCGWERHDVWHKCSDTDSKFLCFSWARRLSCMLQWCQISLICRNKYIIIIIITCMPRAGAYRFPRGASNVLDPEHISMWGWRSASNKYRVR